VALYSLFGKYEWKGEDSNLHYTIAQMVAASFFFSFKRKDTVNSWKLLIKSYSTFKITGSINCVFTGFHV
jgi:hypothetical protein